MVNVNTDPVEIEVVSRAGDRIRADVYLPSTGNGPFPVLLAASAYQKALLRRLPRTRYSRSSSTGPSSCTSTRVTPMSRWTCLEPDVRKGPGIQCPGRKAKPSMT